ncbi:MAG: ABC transporter substrate-binding protein [Parvibaculum sp.]|nr:ABC transporter substrate-binding protein [Parvibaculum sp.]
MTIRNTGMALAAGLLLAAPAATPAFADAQGVSPTEIVLGTHQDLSGPLTSWGVPVRNGLLMAFDEINAAGGVNGRQIRLVVEDTGYDPRRAVLATQKLINRDKVFAIIAALGSPTVIASMPLALRRGVPVLFPFTAADQTYDPYHPLKFASNIPYVHAMRIGTRHFIETAGVTRIGLLYQDDEFGLNVKRGAEQEAIAHGFEIVESTTYKRGATDFSSQIARLRAADVELVVLGTVVRETIGAMQSARSLGWDPIFLCSQACYTPEVHDLGGDTVNGVYAVAQTPIPYPDDPNPKLREWTAAYQERFNLVANVQAVGAYTLARLFAEALERAGPEPTPENLAQALVDMEPWVDPDLGGVPVDFNEGDHLGSKSGFLAQIKDGRWVTLTEPMSVDGDS